MYVRMYLSFVHAPYAFAQKTEYILNNSYTQLHTFIRKYVCMHCIAYTYVRIYTLTTSTYR